MIIIKTTTEFTRFHPIVNFAFFTATIVFSMFFIHPVCALISFGCSFLYYTVLKGMHNALKSLLFLLPMMLVMAIVNPAFNHSGVTILAYLPNGNPLTLESVLYGGTAAVVLASVICWFSCFNEVVSSDKFMYLFGRIIPSLSLIFSMTLRFVPTFADHIREISATQKTLGNDISSGNIIKRCKSAAMIFSTAVNRALEGAVDTSDSMRARGYGLPGRTAFSTFRFSSRDILALSYILLTSACIITGYLLGGGEFEFFPSIHGAGLTPASICTYLIYLALCIYPTSLELMEVIRWQTSK